MISIHTFCVRAAALGTLILLAACGGGGGGGSSSSSSSSSGGSSNDGVRFTLSQSSLSADYYELDPLPGLQVTATATGTLPDTMYIGAVDEGTALDPAIATFIDGTRATFLIAPRVHLAPGTHSGQLRLMACRDPACSRHVGNSPLRLPYTLHVRQDLHVTPNAQEYTGVSGTSLSQVYAVQLPEGAVDFTVQAMSQNNVCGISEKTTTSVRITARSMPSGNYLCTLVFSAGVRGQNVFPNFRFSAPPGGDRDLSIAQTSFTFSTVEGASPAPQALGVTPASWDSRHTSSVSYFSGGPGGWLTLSPSAQGYAVQPSAADLPAGTYYATVIIAGPSPIGAGAGAASVALTVGPGLVRPADRLIAVSSATSAAQLVDSVPVTLAGGPPVGYTATSDSSWLTLPSGTGTTGGALQLDLDNANFRALANGNEHVAHVTITPARPNIAPVTFAVRVDKRIGQVTGLGPYLQTAGKPLRFYVRGVGFTATSDIGARITFGAVANPTVTVINDTTLLVDAPAQSPGNHLVRVSNALSLDMPTRTLKIVAPASYPYLAIPTNHRVGSMLFDGERQRLYYVADVHGETLRVLQAGATWTPLTHDLSALNLGLSADGSQIRLGGALSADANTLVGSLQSGLFGIGPENGNQIPITNDDRMWFYEDALHNEEYVRGYDAVTGTAVGYRVFADSRVPRWLAVPRDGETLFVTTQNGLGILHSSRMAEGVSDHFGGSGGPWRIDSMSDDGQRVAAGAIYDGNLNFLGFVDDSAYDAHYTTPLLTLVSPDGRRGYTLAYHRLDYFNTNDPLPPPYAQPRIYVSDTTQSVQGIFPLRGYFDIAHFPVCREAAQCGLNHAGTISPDGNTLFFAGTQNLVVIPIPDESTLETDGLPLQKMQRSVPGPVMHLWRPHALAH